MTTAGSSTARTRLLVVEDEAIVALDIKGEIESMGHEVCGLADNAEQALRIARRAHPDLALVDVRIKGDVDGIALADALRHELGVPVIYLTSYSDDEHIRRAVQTLPLGYLTKPFQPRELRAAIAIALHNAAMERQLKASEQRFRSAFDHAPLAMALVAPTDGRYVEMNDAMRQLLGATTLPLDTLGPADQSTTEERSLENTRLDQLQSGRVESVQFEKHYRDLTTGHTIPVNVSVSLLPGNSHPPLYLYQVLDLSAQQKAAEQQARLEAEHVRATAAELASQAKNEFLSRMSHELRTPLNAILGFAQLLKLRGVEGVPGAGAYVEHILHAGEHLMALIEDVLDLQRVVGGRRPLQLTHTSLRESIQRVQDLLSPAAAEHAVRLECDVSADLVVVADELRLRQVLLNVGSNAVKYNRPGGSVRWRAQRLPDGRVRLGVEDTGCGIEPAAMARLFEPFERLGQQNSPIPGTGLGLLIARTLMHDMGAELRVASTLGTGTEVTLEFPASSPATGV